MLRAFKIIESNFYLPSSCCIEADILFIPKLRRFPANGLQNYNIILYNYTVKR